MSELHATAFQSTTPVLASLDIERTVRFYESKLGFSRIHVEQGIYGIIQRAQVHLHFWACDDKKIAEATGCRIEVGGVRALYEHCKSEGIVHPDAALELKPWGSMEFAILDPDGKLVTFYESTEA
jgi:hypothetical protein